LHTLQHVLGGSSVALGLAPEWVTVHRANGELLLATVTILSVVVRWPNVGRTQTAGWTWLAVAAAVGTFVLLVSGAYVRGVDATTACIGWPICGDVAFPTLGAPAIAMLHRYIAGGVGIVVILACVEAWRHRRDAPGLG